MAAPLVTSGTFDFSESVSQLVTASLRIAQVVGDEETPTASQMQTGVEFLAAMTKGWQGSGIHVWCEEEAILFLQPNQTQYQLGAGSPDKVTLYQQVTFNTLAVTAAASAGSVTLTSAAGILSGDQFGIQLDAGTNFWTTVNGAPAGNVVTLTNAVPSTATSGAIIFDYTTPLFRPLKVMGGRRYQYSSKLDIQIQMWARLDYANQPNKYVTGVTTAFFYDPQTGQGAYQSNNPVGLMNAWPTPADNTFAMRFTAQRPIQDAGTIANVPDFPIEWNAALKWNLALELGPVFGCPSEQMQIIQTAAAKWFLMASQWDRESESLRFGVAWQPGQRRG